MFSAPAGALDVVAEDGPATAIVLPRDAFPVVKFAARELQYHLEKSTGVEVPIKQEDESDEQAEGLIFVGPCRRTELAGISAVDLPANAFRIRLHGGNLYFVGHDSDGDVVGKPGSPNSIHSSFVRMGTLFAVYEFLEVHLGVRWLWPGEAGEFIQAREEVTVAAWDQTHIPQLVHARVYDLHNAYFKLWQTPAAARKFYCEQSIWRRRHRFALGVDLDYPHGFSDYWEKYSDTHPEYFALAPDGTREPKTEPSLIQMNVAEPALWDRIIDRWGGSDRLINLWENDKTDRDLPAPTPSAGPGTCPATTL